MEAQKDKFIKAARELGVDLDEGKLKEALRRMGRSPDVQHASDCAVHNAPAYEPGPCDCGAQS